MTPRKKKTLDKLRKLAAMAGMTQATAARKLGVTRSYVNALALDYKIKFYSPPVRPRPKRCDVCGFELTDHKLCLRCKWTPARIRQLRDQYGLSPMKMSADVLKMHVWAFKRWEDGGVHPSRRSMLLLERAERELTTRKRKRAA